MWLLVGWRHQVPIKEQMREPERASQMEAITIFLNLILEVTYHPILSPLPHSIRSCSYSGYPHTGYEYQEIFIIGSSLRDCLLHRPMDFNGADMKRSLMRYQILNCNHWLNVGVESEELY